jgi:CMP-N-acetylneuraminic acid synthetase
MGNLFGYTVKEKFSWDIDNNFDFEVAEYLLRKNK